MKVQFLGAAQTVTGSCYMIEANGKRFCVDCGMHQGNKAIEARNRDTKPYRPQDIDFILVTHAHIDHSGLLPKMVREGYAKPIYCTRATGELLELMLEDSAHIQEMEAQSEARKYLRRGLTNPPSTPPRTHKKPPASFSPWTTTRPLSPHRASASLTTTPGTSWVRAACVWRPTKTDAPPV